MQEYNTHTHMLAAQNGHADVIKVLLEAGASIEAKDIVINIILCNNTL